MKREDGIHSFGSPPDIIQIIPATDWYVVYKGEEGGEDSVIPLACWVLLEYSRTERDAKAGFYTRRGYDSPSRFSLPDITKLDRYIDAIDWTRAGLNTGGGFCTEVSNFKEFRYGKEEVHKEEVHMETTILKRGFTFDEACRYLGGLSRMTIYRLLKQGQLSSYHRGVRRYFTKEALDAYIDRLVIG